MKISPVTSTPLNVHDSSSIHAAKIVGKSHGGKESELIKKIKEVIQEKPRSLRSVPFILRTPSQALEHNHKVLEKFNFNYDEIVRSSSYCSITPGSEFRHWKTVEKLFGKHAGWKDMKEIIR